MPKLKRIKTISFLIVLLAASLQVLSQEKVSNIQNLEVQNNNYDPNTVNGQIVQVGETYYSVVADEIAIYYQKMEENAEVIRIPIDLNCSQYIVDGLQYMLNPSKNKLYLFTKNDLWAVNPATQEVKKYKFELTSGIQQLYEIDDLIIATGFYFDTPNSTVFSLEIMDFEGNQIYINDTIGELVLVKDKKVFVFDQYVNNIKKTELLSFDNFELAPLYQGESINLINSNTEGKLHFKNEMNDLLVLDVNNNSITKPCNIGGHSFLRSLFETSKAWVTIDQVSQSTYEIHSISKTTCENKLLPSSNRRISYPVIIEMGDEFSLAEIIEYKLFTYHSTVGETTSVDYYRCIGLEDINNQFYVVHGEYTYLGVSSINVDGTVNPELHRIADLHYENNLFPQATYNEDKELFYFPYINGFGEVASYSVHKNGELDFENFSYTNQNQGSTKDLKWKIVNNKNIGQSANRFIEENIDNYTLVNDIDYWGEPHINSDQTIGFILDETTFNLSIYNRSSKMEERYPLENFVFNDVYYSDIFKFREEIIISGRTTYTFNPADGSLNKIGDFKIYDYLFDDGNLNIFYARLNNKSALYAFDGSNLSEYKPQSILNVDVYQGYQDKNEFYKLIHIQYYDEDNLFIGVNTLTNNIVFERAVKGSYTTNRNYKDIYGKHTFIIDNGQRHKEFISSNGKTIKHLSFESGLWNQFSYFNYYNIDNDLFFTIYGATYRISANGEQSEIELLNNKGSIKGIIYSEGFYYTWISNTIPDTELKELQIYKIPENLIGGELIYTYPLQSCNNNQEPQLIASDSFNNVLFTFTALDEGRELWSFNTTDHSIELIKDFDHLPTNGFGEVQFYKDDYVYFTAREEGEEYQLWKYYTPTFLTNSKTIPIDKEEITAYPNPTTGIIELSETVTEYEVYNINGRLLQKSSNSISKSIDLSSYRQGLYILKVKSNNNSFQTLKIVKT